MATGVLERETRVLEREKSGEGGGGGYVCLCVVSLRKSATM